MGVTLFKEVNYTLSKLIDSIEMGEIGLPEIQRPFVWPNAKVRDLFDSMYRGFPVGYLLFWSNGTGGGHKQIGANTKQKIPSLLIVDGQQRLTSLYAVLKGIQVVRENYRRENIYIAFSPLSEKFEVTDASIRKDPEYIPDISMVWSETTDMFELAEEYLNKLKLTREVSSDEAKAIKKAINNLDNIQNYPFTALEISSAANEEQVADIFVRVNSRGTPLNQADFILTLMSVHWDEGRADLEEFCRDARQPALSSASPFNYLIQPDPDQLIRVDMGVGFDRARLQHAYSVLRGKDMETGEFSIERRDTQFSVLREAQAKVLDLQNWQDFLKALRVAGYLSQNMITSNVAILYAYVFFLIGKHRYNVDHFTLRNIIARWFFTITLVGRYTGSFESYMEQDLARFRDVSDSVGFVTTLEHIIQDTLTEDFWKITLPNDLATSSPRSPSLFAFYASQNLLHANVLLSKLTIPELLDPAIKAKKSATERHHLFPRGYLTSQGISDLKDINQIANYALVEWDDNIEISDQAPKDYFPKYAKRYSEVELKQMMFWHALPQGWDNMDYFKFLEERRKLIAQIIREGFNRLG